MTAHAQTRVGGVIRPERLFASDAPLIAAFALFPLWWLLGLGEFIFMIMSIPLAFWLFRRRDLRVPRGFGIWLLFLVWMLLSALALDQFSHYIAFGYRAWIYFSATVMFLFVYNASENDAPSGRILKALVLYFGYAVVGGYLGLVAPEGSLTTPMEMVLPGFLTENEFVLNMVHPIFAQVQDFLGFPLPRPAAPFIFTNEWGANVALLLPITFAATPYMSRGWRIATRVILILSIVPIVVSVNRGLWVTLIGIFAYMAIRLAARGRISYLRWIVGAAAIVAVLVLFTPLSVFVTGRLDNAHSDESRLGLYTAVQDQVGESPLIGFGSPRANDNPNQPAVGTHGHFWTVLFSHGVPGAILFVAFIVALLARTWRAQGHWLWLHAIIFAAFMEMWYYGLLPGQMHIILIAAALVMRHLKTTESVDDTAGADVGERVAVGA